MRRAVLLAGLLCALWAAPAAAAPAFDPGAFDAAVAAAKAAMMANPDLALARARLAQQAARRIAPGGAADRAGATALWLQGEALTRLNRPEDALPILGDGLAETTRAGAGTKLHADILFSIGSAEAALGRVSPALANFQRAHEIFRVIGDARGQAKSLQTIGGLYSDAGDNPRSLDYYRQAAEVYRGDPAFALAAHNNLGETLKKLGRLREASGEYARALGIARQLGSPMLEARVLTNLASNELMERDFAGAARHGRAALALTGGGEAAGWRPYAWGVLAQEALARGHEDQAAALIANTFAGVDLAATSPPFRDFHETAYRIYQRRGDTALALAHLEAYKRLDDEARQLASSTNAALMTARFDYANQTLKIAKLKSGELRRDALIAQSKVRLHNILTGGVAAVGVTVSLLLLGGFVSLRRSRNEVRAANAELSAANTSLASALKAKTEFLATTSHEIRTPLNGILGMTEIILADRAIDAGLRDRLGLVHTAGLTMRALVDDILDMAKIETGNLTISKAPMDLTALLDDTAKLWAGQAAAKGLTLVLDIADCPARIVEDEGRLRQIVFNLMSNAIKFTDTGSVTLRAAAEGDSLVVAVTDTGMGIPEDRVAEIFESFRQLDGGTTRRFGGTGLGLAICRRLIEAMGGGVTVRSAPSAGACFTVTLPLERAGAAVAASSAHPAPARLAEARLLLIEANPLSQSLLRAVLGGQVAAFEACRSADEAGDRLAAADLVLAEAATLGADHAGIVAGARALVASGAALHILIAAPGPAVRAALEAEGAVVLAKPIAAPALIAALAAGIEGAIDAVRAPASAAA